MVERLIVDGREVVQIPAQDYDDIMAFIAEEKQKKDAFYRERIEMAEQYLASGKPGLDPEEMLARCRQRAEERRKLRA